jgi:phage terminase large subunit-like protein
VTAQLELPAGWETWPPGKKAELREVLRQAKSDAPLKAWLSCTRPDCDGLPHPGAPYKHARPSQRPPGGDWLLWLILAGRGYGKTRSGAEWAWRKARTQPRGALVAPTAADARDVMVEGESGILAVTPSVFRPKYEPSKRRLTYPNGALQTVFSADEPDRLRGPQHYYAWCDELAAWTRLDDAWSNLELGLRLGLHPEVLATTTPRPKPLIVRLAQEDSTTLSSGTTYENLQNLAPAFRERVLARYEGTRLGRQELLAELLSDVPGALWTIAMLEADGARCPVVEVPQLERIVVAVDPAVTSNEDSDETGIVVAGKHTPDDLYSLPHHLQLLTAISGLAGRKLTLGESHGYVLHSEGMRDRPEQVMRQVVALYRRFDADAVVIEANNGGDYLPAVLRAVDPTVPVQLVHASRGKLTRAEPVAALYEQQRVHHVGPREEHAELENQLTTWDGAGKTATGSSKSQPSPDRLDALVWAITALMVSKLQLGAGTRQQAVDRRLRGRR